jgi:hypothetical protein
MPLQNATLAEINRQQARTATNTKFTVQDRHSRQRSPRAGE